jgi:hypothetical protein
MSSFAESQRRGREDHARCVRAGCHAGQAEGAVESGGDAAGGKGDEGEILIGPFWTLGHLRGSCK